MSSAAAPATASRHAVLCLKKLSRALNGPTDRAGNCALCLAMSVLQKIHLGARALRLLEQLGHAPVELLRRASTQGDAAIKNSLEPVLLDQAHVHRNASSGLLDEVEGPVAEDSVEYLNPGVRCACDAPSDRRRPDQGATRRGGK